MPPPWTAGGQNIPGNSAFGTKMGAMAAIRDAIVAALIQNAAYVGSVPGQVVIGWPTANQLNQIIPQGGGQITVYPVPGTARSVGRYRPDFTIPIPAATAPSLTAIVSGQSLTFTGTGTVGAVVNVHTFVGFGGNQLHDAFYQTRTTDTVATVNTAVAAAINALGLPNVQAVVTPDGVIEVMGVTYLACNVVASAQLAAEVQRVAERVQVSVWAPDGYSRGLLDDIIQSNLGQELNRFLQIGTSPAALCLECDGSVWKEQSQSDYGVYEAHIMFSCEYPLLAIQPASLVGAVEPTLQISAVTPFPAIGILTFGGPAQPGQVVTVVFTPPNGPPVTVTHLVTESPLPYVLAEKVQERINKSPAAVGPSAFLLHTPRAGPVLTLTALAGMAGSSIGVAASISPGNGTVVFTPTANPLALTEVIP